MKNTIKILGNNNLANNFLTSIHSLVNCFLSFYSIVYQNNILFKPIMVYSIGHLLCDTYYFQYKIDINKSKNVYILHHSIFMCSWLLVFYDMNLINYLLYLLLSEITILPLNLKYHFKKNKNHQLELLFGVITYVLFFIFRIINFSFHLYLFIKNKNLIVLSFFIPLLFLQYYWFGLMTLKVLEKLNIIQNLLYIW